MRQHRKSFAGESDFTKPRVGRPHLPGSKLAENRQTTANRKSAASLGWRCWWAGACLLGGTDNQESISGRDPANGASQRRSDSVVVHAWYCIADRFAVWVSACNTRVQDQFTGGNQG